MVSFPVSSILLSFLHFTSSYNYIARKRQSNLLLTQNTIVIYPFITVNSITLTIHLLPSQLLTSHFYLTSNFTITHFSLSLTHIWLFTFHLLTPHLPQYSTDIDAPGGGFFVSLRKFMAFFLLVSVVASIMDDKTGAAGAAISSRLGMSSTVRQAEERYASFICT